MGYKYSAEQVIEAIKAANGNISQAAKNMGCSRRTIYNYVENYTTVARAVEDEREKWIDFAESQLQQLVREKDKTAIIFTLKTQGKGRGYVERHEYQGEGEFTINVKYEESGVSLPSKPPPKTAGNHGV